LIIKIFAHFGRLDVLVNNAGIVIEGDLVNTTPSEWDLVMNVNSGGVYRCSRAAIPLMEESIYSSIINISSTQALSGFMNASAYAISKGGNAALRDSIGRWLGLFAKRD
jgi:NAD(P)-dependent dehydrogenase (short-subunit alcohol dehydrogenase family)